MLHGIPTRRGIKATLCGDYYDLPTLTLGNPAYAHVTTEVAALAALHKCPVAQTEVVGWPDGVSW